MTKSRSKPVPTSVPSSTSELGTRFEVLVNTFGTRKRAAEVAGVSEDSIYKYMRGDHEPPLMATARMCAAVGISLDWLVTGQGTMRITDGARGQPQLDLDLLELAFRYIEELIAERRASPTPADRAEMLALLYRDLLVAHEAEREKMANMLNRGAA